MIDPVLQAVRTMIQWAQERRCVICGWPLTNAVGCTLENCSYRPESTNFDYAGICMRREILDGTSFSVLRKIHSGPEKVKQAA